MRRHFSDRRVHLAIGFFAITLAALALLLAAFPWGIFKRIAEQRLTARFERQVRIGAMERVDRFGFTPTIALRDVRIPGPGWAGRNDLVRAEQIQVSFPALPLLIGKLSPREITVDGAQVHLVRAKDGRENWRDERRTGKSGQSTLEGLTVRRSRLIYRDAKRERQVNLAVTSDTQGLRLSGPGVVRGAKVDVTLRAPAVTGNRQGGWPFDARIAGDQLRMHAKGVMAAPLDTSRMTLDVTAEAADLALIDAVIEAGLFQSQPVSLSAHVRREPQRWLIDRLNGRIGRSDISGTLTVDKVDGRSKLDGTVRSRQMDFADLSSDEGLARAAAKEQALGPRIVPDTRVNLAKVGRTDGRINFRVDRIVSREGPSSLTNMAGTLVLDHRVLTIAPLRIGLRRGYITGRAVVDQGDNGPVPLVRLDLKLIDSSIPALGGGGGTVTGRVDGRAVLAGRGSTIREAVGNADGRIGIVARDGALPTEIAAALGFDAGRAILAGSDDRAALRCVVAGFTLRGGRGRAGPFVVDTAQSRLDGTGTLTFPQEALSIRLTGAPKRDAILRLPGSATMTGTLSRPDIVVPPEVKSVGNVFKALGRAITGRQGPVAQDADCERLSARVLR
jgi:hypothetical protein